MWTTVGLSLLLILAISIPTRTSSQAPKAGTSCEANWIQNDKRNTCYSISVVTREAWSDAQANCVEQGGTLVTINDEREQKWLAAQFNVENGKSHELWTGLAKLCPEDKLNKDDGLRWVDGSLTAYRPLAKPTEKEDILCAMLHVSRNASGGILHYANCTEEAGYICEKLLTTNASIRGDGDCDDGSWCRKGDNCYKLFQSANIHHFNDAERSCNEHGAHLVSLHSENETQFVVELTDAFFDVTAFRVGLHEQTPFHTMHWTDGSPVDFLRWAPGQPDETDATGFGESCAAVISDSGPNTGMLEDVRCDDDIPFVCHKPTFSSLPITIRRPVEQTNGSCREGWLPYGNRCFKLFTGKKYATNFLTAQAFCQGEGTKEGKTSLASIRNVFEQMFLIAQLKSYTDEFWIGLTTSKRFQYIWLDEAPVRFTHLSELSPTELQSVEGAEEASNRISESNCFTLSASSLNSWQAQAPEECQKSNFSFICAEFSDTRIESRREHVLRNAYCTDDEFSFGDDTCYYFQASVMNWNDASRSCEKRSSGGHLISIVDLFELAKVVSLAHEIRKSLLPGGEFWIGLSVHQDLFQQGNLSFSWSDTWPVFLTIWGPGQPNVEKKCVKMQLHSLPTISLNDQYGAEWKTEDCELAMPSICKRTRTEPPQLVEASSGDCAKGWIESKEACYKLYLKPADMATAALHYCKRENSSAQLASFHSRADMEYVMQQVRMRLSSFQPLYIGLQRLADGRFEWMDESPLDFVSWENNDENAFANSELTFCTAVLHNGFWRLLPCDLKLPFICMVAKVRHYKLTESALQSPLMANAVNVAVVASAVVITVLAVTGGLYFGLRGRVFK